MSHDNIGRKKASGANGSNADVLSIFQSEKDVLSLLEQIRRLPRISHKTFRSVDFDMLKLNGISGIQLKEAYMCLRRNSIKSVTMAAECDLIKAMVYKVLTQRRKECTASDVPKKPMTSYMLFGKKYWEKTKAKNPSLLSSQRCILIGEMWRKLSDDKKQKYRALAKDQRDSYKKAMNAFLDEHHVESKEIVTPPFFGTGFDLFFKLNKRRLKAERGNSVGLREAASLIYYRQMSDEERRSMELEAKRLTDSSLNEMTSDVQPQCINSGITNDLSTSRKSKNRTTSASSYSLTSFPVQPLLKKLRPNATLQKASLASKADTDSDDSLSAMAESKTKGVKIKPTASTVVKAVTSSKRKKPTDVSSSSSSESDSNSDTSSTVKLLAGAVKKSVQATTKNNQAAAAASTDSDSGSDTSPAANIPAAAVKKPAKAAANQSNAAAASSNDSDTSSTVRPPAAVAARMATTQAVKPSKTAASSSESDSDSSSAGEKTPAAVRIVPPPNIIAPKPKFGPPPAAAVANDSSTDENSDSDAADVEKLAPSQVDVKIKPAAASPQKGATFSFAAQHSRPTGQSPKKIPPGPHQIPSTPVVSSHKRRNSPSASSNIVPFKAKGRPQVPINAQPTQQPGANYLHAGTKPKKRKR